MLQSALQEVMTLFSLFGPLPFLFFLLLLKIPLASLYSPFRNVEYLTDGGNNWIHTAFMDGKQVVINQLKPEVQDVCVAIQEIEHELMVHSQLSYKNIVSFYGTGHGTNRARFLVMERLDGGTLTQLLGYNNRIKGIKGEDLPGANHKECLI